MPCDRLIAAAPLRRPADARRQAKAATKCASKRTDNPTWADIVQQLIHGSLGAQGITGVQGFVASSCSGDASSSRQAGGICRTFSRTRGRAGCGKGASSREGSRYGSREGSSIEAGAHKGRASTGANAVISRESPQEAAAPNATADWMIAEGPAVFDALLVSWRQFWETQLGPAYNCKPNTTATIEVWAEAYSSDWDTALRTANRRMPVLSSLSRDLRVGLMIGTPLESLLAESGISHARRAVLMARASWTKHLDREAVRAAREAARQEAFQANPQKRNWRGYKRKPESAADTKASRQMAKKQLQSTDSRQNH